MQIAKPAEFAAIGQARTLFQKFEDHSRSMRLALVACAGLFIMFGPAVGQIFGWHSIYIREWVMFSGGGIGVLKGTFTLHRPDGAAVRMTPLDVLGLKRYPGALPDQFDHLIFEESDLRGYASRVCDPVARTARLAYHGLVGTRQGWRPLDVEDVCGLPRTAPLDPSGTAGDPP